MDRFLDQQRPWTSPEVDSLHQKVVEGGGVGVRGVRPVTTTLQGGGASRRLGPAIMPASAPRPLALAGVTRNQTHQLLLRRWILNVDRNAIKPLGIDHNVVTAN